MDQRKNKSSRHPENNKARKIDMGGSCGKKNRWKMDYSCDRVDTTHWEKKSVQTYKRWRDEIDKYSGTPAWTEHTRDRKYWEKHAEAFILQWNDNG